LNVYADPITIDFDGMSDTSDFLSRFLTSIFNTVRERAISLSKYSGRNGFWKLNILLNTVLELIPDEIDILDTNVYLQGGLSNNFYTIQNY
jgi:hypothetical protein